MVSRPSILKNIKPDICFAVVPLLRDGRIFQTEQVVAQRLLGVVINGRPQNARLPAVDQMDVKCDPPRSMRLFHGQVAIFSAKNQNCQSKYSVRVIGLDGPAIFRAAWDPATKAG